MRYTEYHAGKAVIKDKNKLSEAMEKLARYEDAEEKDRLGQWIPCSERLPKDRQIVVADIECGIEDRMCIFAYFKIVDHIPLCCTRKQAWINGEARSWMMGRY